MAMQRLNMIEQMNEAWNDKKNQDSLIYQQRCRNLMSHGFVEIEKIYKEYCNSKGYDYEDEVFYIFQRLIVFLMKCDGEFLQGEYDTYCLICNWAQIKPLSIEDVNAFYPKIQPEQIIDDINLISGLRDLMEPDNYQTLVLSFCYLSLIGDNCFDENEYYIIRCFYKAGYDYVPSTWQQFKSEW